MELLHALDGYYPAVKLTHEREGLDGNVHRSVVTQRPDLRAGMVAYQNYQRISGRPEPGIAWDPAAITPEPWPRAGVCWASYGEHARWTPPEPAVAIAERYGWKSAERRCGPASAIA
jgi:hypothetical protein